MDLDAWEQKMELLDKEMGISNHRHRSRSGASEQ